MTIAVSSSKEEMGKKAAAAGAREIRDALSGKEEAHIILATGASQFEMLDHLVASPDIDWSRVVAFHLDEYVGIDDTHPASFRRYLKERFVQRLPGLLADFHFIHPGEDPAAEIERLNRLIEPVTIDVAFVGIGENAHLAFNDPPADFNTERPYLLVDLDEACRRQQYNEGWFESMSDVPTTAISMSVHEILESQSIICTVPDERKAEAVRRTVEGPITPDVPASILQRHASCTLYLDPASASLLPNHALEN